MACTSRMLRTAVLAATTVACAYLPALASAAPGGGALYVNHTGTVTAAAAGPGGASNGCANAQYATVQSAVDAAHPGQTVYVCGTAPYYESVLVQKDLKLTGDPGAAIQAPATNPTPNTTFFSGQGLQTPNSVLTIIGNVNVQVQGLTIEGPFANQGCSGDDFGVLQLGGGHLQLNNDQVLNIGAADPSLGGCQYGVAIQIGREYWPNTGGGYNVMDFVGNAEIMNTTVSGYQKNGITVDGPGSQAHLRNNTIDGGGPNGTIARNGIQISRGATGEVEHNSINNNEYTGPGSFASATGVLVYGGCGDPLDLNVQVHDNTLSNNDTGVSIGNFDPTCSTAPSTHTNNQVHDNTITKNDGETNHSPFTDESGKSYTAYQAGISDTGNNDDIHNNRITGTVAAGVDSAFGPQTAPGGPFLVPIDIQTYPPINTKVHGNTYDGKPTNPPY